MADEDRKRYRGAWDGLSAVTIAQLMNCSPRTARRHLNRLALEKGAWWRVTLEDIGKLIAANRVQKTRTLMELIAQDVARRRVAAAETA